MLEIAVFIVHLAACALILSKIKAVQLPGVSIRLLLGLFMLKVLVSLGYIELHRHLIQGGDIFDYFNDGIYLASVIFEEPLKGFRLLFINTGGAIPESLRTEITNMGFWSDSSAYFVVRIHAILALISFSSCWIHAIWFSLAATIGLCLLFKSVFEAFQSDGLGGTEIELFGKSLSLHFLFTALFCFPSILFWTGGLHKEAIICFALGLFYYSWSKLFDGLVAEDRESHFRLFKQLAWVVVALLLIYFCRRFLLLFLVPPIIVQVITKQRFRAEKTMIVHLVCFIGFLCCISFVQIPGYEMNFLELIESKRQAFSSLQTGNSQIETPEYDAGLVSFFKSTPFALFNGLFRPHTFEIQSAFTALAAIENSLLLALCLTFLARIMRRPLPRAVLHMLLFSVAVVILIGLIVPNLGAIARYRVMGLMVLVPIICSHLFLRIPDNNTIRN